MTCGAVLLEHLLALGNGGISNMIRNLGGAIGTAVLATIVTKREQFHSNIIGQSDSGAGL
jgi:hypothetical protein